MKKKGKYPDYMRSSVSPQFLAKNPLYKNIFKKCVICSKYSLKPVGLDRIKDISQIKDTNERKCSLCGFVHVKNLSVYTTPTLNITREKIQELEDQAMQRDVIFQQGEKNNK